MIKVCILGGGSIAIHLAKAFLETSDVKLTQIYARNIQQISQFKHLTSITNSLELLTNTDIFIIAVSDNAIAEISSKITHRQGLFVHTSGSTSINEIKNVERKGVFYLLQSFSKKKEVDFNLILFCLETSTKEDLSLLESLAKTIGKKIYYINSEQRNQLHIAAVFVNNFTNHMYKIGHDICEKYDISFEVLQPLIKETALKIEALNPEETQTGPAKRNDTKTIENHLNLLTENQQKIYQLITKSIQNNGKKL